MQSAKAVWASPNSFVEEIMLRLSKRVTCRGTTRERGQTQVKHSRKAPDFQGHIQDMDRAGMKVYLFICLFI